MRYWYKIIKELCDKCGNKIGESRIRVYDKEEANRVIVNTPVCNNCYRNMKL